jgi:7-cyano-7-deazaguanine synthase
VTPAALLLSGGIESVAVAYLTRPSHAITIDYGQAAASSELRVARQIATMLDIRHECVQADFASLGTGIMAKTDNVPDAPSPEWWPFRNQFLITVAAMFAVKSGLSDVMIGTVKSDTLHADNSPEFLRLVDELVAAQEGGIRVSAPAKDLTTAELVKRSRVPFSVLSWTHSCHTGALACGQCRGCRKHIEIIELFGLRAQ